MQITILGILLLPLSLFWAARPIRLLQLAFVAGVFEAGAALVVGSSFGLPPAMVPGLLFIAFIMLQYAVGMRYPAEGRVFRAMIPLLALLGYALISEVILPSLFAGIMVWPQKPDSLQPGLVPLAFNSGNITQPLYLAMNVVVAVSAALFLTRREIPYRSIVKAYLLGGYIAVGIAFWQFAARIGGLPFPDKLFYSNPGWAIVEQNLGSVPRIQGPFSEPAGLAFYLSGLCFCCLWLIAKGHRMMWINLLLPLAILAMLLSTSTTGILILATGLPGMLLLAMLRTDRKASTGLIRKTAILMLGSSLLLGPVFVIKPALLHSVSEVVHATLAKGDSDSYSERTSLDAAALASIAPTYGLGVGWGSFRTSSLLPGLLANAGLFGVAMVCWVFVRVAMLSTLARATPGHSAQSLVDGFSAALCGQFAAALLSAPTIGSLAFFLQLGCVIGGAARMSLDAGSRHMTPFTIRVPETMKAGTS